MVFVFAVSSSPTRAVPLIPGRPVASVLASELWTVLTVPRILMVQVSVYTHQRFSNPGTVGIGAIW